MRDQGGSLTARQLSGWASILVAASLLACDVDGSVGRDEPNGGGSGGSSTGSSTAGGASDDASEQGDGSTAGEGGGTGGSGRDTVDSEPTATTQDTMPTDVPPACHPVPDDSECARCRKANCCNLLVNCLSHDSCLCWWDCIVTDHTAEQCTLDCGDGAAAYVELATCVEGSCDICVE